MALIRQADTHQHFRHAVVLDLADLHRQGEQIQAAAGARARQAISEAEVQRAKLLAGAAEEGRAKGYREGYEKGMGEGAIAGREAAIQKTRQRLAEIEKAWAGGLAQFERERTRLLLDANQSVVSLALRAAELIVKRTIAAEPGVVADQVAAVLGALAKPTRLRVRVYPGDEALVRSALPSLMQRYSAAEHVEVVADASVTRGGCVATSACGGEIDASVESQLERLVNELTPERAAEVRAGGGAGPGGLA